MTTTRDGNKTKAAMGALLTLKQRDLEGAMRVAKLYVEAGAWTEDRLRVIYKMMREDGNRFLARAAAELPRPGPQVRRTTEEIIAAADASRGA